MDLMKWWDAQCERYVDEGSACELRRIRRTWAACVAAALVMIGWW